MNILYICEKPAQARDIAKHLGATQRYDGYLTGNGHQVTWCVGHLLELALPEYYRPDIKPWRIEKLPVIPKQWELLISQKTKRQFNIIKQLLKQTQHVVIASDPDRTGEEIVREILEYCCYQGKIERLWLNALDDVSIKKGLATLRSGNATENLYYAAKARSYSDWLIGLNLTMAASSLFGTFGKGVLSVGRVQTPTLRLVVDRDRVIEHFKPQDYFTLKVLFTTASNSSFWATWEPSKSIVDENGLCLDQQVVENIAAKVENEPGQVNSFQEAKKTQRAPFCFSLSNLQKKASSLFGYSAKQILAIAQTLYETHKAITYPRTDSSYLPIEQFEEASSVLAAIAKVDPEMQSLVKQCNSNFKSLVWNNKKVTAHHAMIPTLNENVEIEKMSQEELNLYDLIRRQYLAQFLGDYHYLQRKIKIACAGELFTATANMPLTTGWKRAFTQSHLNKNEEENINETIPLLQPGETIDNQETKVQSKQTKPPARFTEGTLIEAMKTVGKFVEDEELKKILKNSNGIGTEATRANILEILFKRGYLQRKSKQVISTKQGRALIDLLPDLIKNPILTAQWEQKLEAIADGKDELKEFVATQSTLLKEILAQLQDKNGVNKIAVLQLQSNIHNGKVYLCPKCKSPLRRLKNKTGKAFWGCSQYPQCDFTTWEKANKPRI